MKLRTNVSVVRPLGPQGEIEVKLSRRNLLALLHKLDWEGSKQTIDKLRDGLILIVVAEDDKEHYGDEKAGVMNDETEHFIEQQAEMRRKSRERVESQDALEYVTDLLGSWKPNV